eukprot:765802-Hanusia_phi.AAC.10
MKLTGLTDSVQWQSLRHVELALEELDDVHNAVALQYFIIRNTVTSWSLELRAGRRQAERKHSTRLWTGQRGEVGVTEQTALDQGFGCRAVGDWEGMPRVFGEEG